MSTPAGGAIRYEPDDRCGLLVALGVGVQGVMLGLATIVLIVAVTARAGGQDDGYVAWAVFAALIIAGGLTALQAARFRRFGAGHILIMGPSPNYVAVSVLALAVGGPGLLATLTVAAGVFYLGMSLWLPLLRRLLTPVVSGTVMMLIAATVLPIVLDRVQDVPESAPAATGPVVALVTLASVVVLSLRVAGAWRVWSPLIAVGSGCLAAFAFGAVEVSQIGDAAWVGLPDSGFGGLDLAFDADFWALLPAFVVVALVGTVKNIGDCIAVQQVSWRRPRATDFRLVQGSLNTNGIGIMLSGLAGTPPTSVYSSSSSSLIHLTGVASRSVGYAIGGFMVMLALLPKVGAVLLAIPSPVMGAYLVAAFGVLFVSGMQTLMADGLDRGRVLTVGIAFSLGIGLDNQTIGADLLGDRWGPLIDNGMLLGAVVAVLMSQFAEHSSRRGRARLEVELTLAAAGRIDEFLRGFASGIGWDETAAQRLCSVGEETLMSLLEQDGGPLSSSAGDSSEDARRLVVVARRSGASVGLEFLAVLEEENLEDRLAHLNEEARSVGGLEDGEISLRLLRHYASSVHHQKFYGLDIVTVQVKAAP
ncbi:MAG: hypothetical protein OXH78_11465 [Acidimicrobiaceae bacterium]|nr:hypothetical protein [Acidimicrobiaceae bacterium]